MSMDISKLPSNSNASKKKEQVTNTVPEGKRTNKVVTGKVKTKRNEVRRFKDTFIAEDTHNVKDYVVNDLVIPTIKNLVVDLVQNSVEMLILGGRRGTRNGRSTTDTVSFRDYGRYSRNDRYSEPRSSRRNFDYDDIVFSTRADAESVLDQMQFILDKYQIVRVADLYDMCELTAPFTSNNYGWTSLARARVSQVRGGYIIELPRASVID